jgi:hypothetical protein
VLRRSIGGGQAPMKRFHVDHKLFKLIFFDVLLLIETGVVFGLDVWLTSCQFINCDDDGQHFASAEGFSGEGATLFVTYTIYVISCQRIGFGESV